MAGVEQSAGPGGITDLEATAEIAAVAISAAVGRMSAPAVYGSLMRGGAWPLRELGGPWAPPLARARRAPAQEDVTGTYVTLDDYVLRPEDWDAMPEGVDSPATLARHILRTHDPHKLLWSLARMNQLSSKLGNPSGVVEGYREYLPEGWRAAFDSAMRVGRRRGGGLGRVVAFRQPLLAAMRYVLTAPAEDLVGTEPAPLSAAVMLSHAVGVGLTRVAFEEDGSENPEEAFMGVFPRWAHRAMAAAALLGMEIDAYHSVFRTLSLWRDWGPRLEKYRLEKDPAELVRDATVMEVEDLMGVGLMMWAYERSWAPGAPQMRATVEAGGDVERETLDAFLRVTAATPEEMRQELARHTGPYDFFPFQQKPVLRLGDELVVLDNDFLLESFTSGLYHRVFAHEKAKLENPKKLPIRWTQAFGEMFELSVEEQVRAMAPHPDAVFTEEDIERAYGGVGTRPDIGVYYGRHLVLLEVVSGRLKAKARSGGDLEAFEDDVKKLLRKKFRQLGDAANRLLRAETRLTGRPPTPGLRIVPVVVQPDLFPSDALTLELQDRVAERTGLFKDPNVLLPSAILAAELDMLEGLLDRRGVEPHVPLRAWMGLPKKISLLTFLISRYGNAYETFRSARITERVEAGFGDIESRAARPGPPRDGD